MVKKKQPYESPEITATRVELESSICTGSVDVEPGNDNNLQIEGQEVNESGDFSNGGWD